MTRLLVIARVSGGFYLGQLGTVVVQKAEEFLVVHPGSLRIVGEISFYQPKVMDFKYDVPVVPLLSRPVGMHLEVVDLVPSNWVSDFSDSIEWDDDFPSADLVEGD